MGESKNMRCFGRVGRTGKLVGLEQATLRLLQEAPLGICYLERLIGIQSFLLFRQLKPGKGKDKRVVIMGKGVFKEQ